MFETSHHVNFYILENNSFKVFGLGGDILPFLSLFVPFSFRKDSEFIMRIGLLLSLLLLGYFSLTKR